MRSSSHTMVTPAVSHAAGLACPVSNSTGLYAARRKATSSQSFSILHLPILICALLVCSLALLLPCVWAAPLAWGDTVSASDSADNDVSAEDLFGSDDDSTDDGSDDDGSGSDDGSTDGGSDDDGSGSGDGSGDDEAEDEDSGDADSYSSSVVALLGSLDEHVTAFYELASGDYLELYVPVFICLLLLLAVTLLNTGVLLALLLTRWWRS